MSFLRSILKLNDLIKNKINSFGFGGSNAVIVMDDAFHTINAQQCLGHHRTEEIPPTLEGYKATKRQNFEASASLTRVDVEPFATDMDRPRLLVWSAADEKGIERLNTLYRTYFRRNSPLGVRILDDLIYTLVAGRTTFSWRAHLTIDGPQPMRLEQLNVINLAATRATESRKVAFIFTGQGAQYARMGVELLDYPHFKDSLTKSETELYKLGCHWSLTSNPTQETGTLLVLTHSRRAASK